MGNKGSQTVTQQQNQTYTPAAPIGQAGQQAINMATTAANAPFQMPVAPIAPFNPFQQYGFGETFGAQGMAQPYFNTGSAFLGGSAAPISGEDVANYYNPMASNVFANLQDIYGQQMRETTGKATQTAGGVGADRIAVAQANLAKEQGLSTGQIASQMWQQALQAAEQQKQMMAGAGYGFGQMGPAAQSAQLQGIQALLGAGGQQQNLAQAQLNAFYQNQLAQIAYPFQTAQYLAGITGGLAPAMGGTTAGTATTTQPSPSLLAQILGVGTAAAGVYGGLGGTFSNPFAGTAAGSTPTNMAFNTSGLGGGNIFSYNPATGNRGGRIIDLDKSEYADGGSEDDSDYGKLSHAAYQRYLGQMLPSAEAGNPMSREMLEDIGGSLPMQGGGSIGIKDFLSPVITGDWEGPFSTIGAFKGKGPFSTAGLINMLNPKQQPSSQGQSGSQPTQDSGNSGIGSGLLNILHSMGMQSGGATDQPPPVPGASVPKVGGASPIPFISLPTGSGEFHNRLQFSSPQQQQSGGSGSGMGQAMNMAMTMLPLLMAARGGGVNPFDIGQPFQAGGDTETIDMTDAPPLDEESLGLNQRPNWSPMQENAPAMVAAGATPQAFRGEEPLPAAATPTSFTPPQRPLMTAPFGLPQSQLPYPDATQRDVGQNLASSPWMALVEAGARMAQTRGPIGSVIGAGIEAGAGELKGQRKSLQSEEDINLKAQHLAQQAQIHLDEYTRMKPYEAARLEQERYQWQPGTGTDPDTGARVQGAWRLPTRSGEQPTFMPGTQITGKGGIRETALERNINMLVQKHIAPNEEEAFNILHHSLQDQATFQRLVQNEQKFLADRPENAGKSATAIRSQAEENIKQAQQDARMRAPAAAKSNAGTETDPIPYVQGIKPERGKFYRMPDGTVRPAQ